MDGGFECHELPHSNDEGCALRWVASLRNARFLEAHYWSGMSAPSVSEPIESVLTRNSDWHVLLHRIVTFRGQDSQESFPHLYVGLRADLDFRMQVSDLSNLIYIADTRSSEHQKCQIRCKGHPWGPSQTRTESRGFSHWLWVRYQRRTVDSSNSDNKCKLKRPKAQTS